jgi:hypothetical protein
MNCYALLPILFAVLFLGSMPSIAQDTVNEERQAQLEDLCRKSNGQKVRPPKSQGLYWAMRYSCRPILQERMLTLINTLTIR